MFIVVIVRVLRTWLYKTKVSDCNQKCVNLVAAEKYGLQDRRLTRHQ